MAGRMCRSRPRLRVGREREDRLSISEDSRNMFTLCLALAVALTVNVAAGAGARPFSVLRAR